MKKPHVIIVHSHDIGQHISPYGIETVDTPNFERLAQNGVVFDNSFCTSPGCSPSRAALFTGNYSHTAGTMGLTHGYFGWKLYDDQVHMAQLMSHNGYKTRLCGVFHEHDIHDVERLGYEETSFERSAPEVATAAAQYIKEHANDAIPFFMSVGFFEPHRPFDCRGSKPDDSKGVYIPPYIPQETDEEKAAAYEEFAGLQGSIKQADQGLGIVMDAIENNGIKDSVVLIYTADHGIAMPRAKCTLYDPGIEVPTMIQAPCWGVEPGSRKEGLVSTVDYYAMLTEGLGLSSSHEVEGVSFFDYLTGKSGPHRNAIYAEKNFHTDYDPIRCIRTEKYKLIINFDHNVLYDCPSDIAKGKIYQTSIEKYLGHRKGVELYDLSADPWEQNNVAEEPTYKEILNDLRTRLHAWMKETHDPLLDGPIASNYYKKQIAALTAD